jgi:hypothetical protein
MDHKKVYDKLISTRLDRVLDKNEYYEKHHIIPKSMGGSNSNENLVCLTAREHYLAHWLLAKIYKNGSMICAFNSFCLNSNGKRIVTSRQYEFARKEYIIWMKNNTTDNFKNSSVGKKWMTKGSICKRVLECDIEQNENDGWELGRIIKHRKPHSQETKDKIGQHQKGRVHSEEHRKKNGDSSRNRIWIYNNETGLHKMIQREDLENYKGWELGRINLLEGNGGKHLKRMVTAINVTIMDTVFISSDEYKKNKNLYKSLNYKKFKWFDKDGNLLDDFWGAIGDFRKKHNISYKRWYLLRDNKSSDGSYIIEENWKESIDNSKTTL